MAAAMLLARFSAFACGAVVALALLGNDQDLRAASSGTLHTCAAADGTLRVTEPAVPCQPEERRVRLKLPGDQDPECQQDDARVEKLERRLRDLEAQDRRGTLRGRRVVAPFEVVTDNAKRVLRIEEQNVTFYNRDEKPVVWIVADDSGGLVLTQTASGNRQASLGAQNDSARLVVHENDQDRIDLGRRPNGRYGLQVFSPGNKHIAYLGQSQAGTGLAWIGDTAGVTKVTMSISDGAGQVRVFSGAETLVGAFSASGERAGHLLLADGAGATMVEAGVNPDGAGVVRTGPNFRHSGVGIVGLVPSFILGKP